MAQAGRGQCDVRAVHRRINCARRQLAYAGYAPPADSFAAFNRRGLAATIIVIASLLWAVREFHAFYLLYALWIAQFAVGINRLATGGNARLFAALSLLVALIGASVFLVAVNPFNVQVWDP